MALEASLEPCGRREPCSVAIDQQQNAGPRYEYERAPCEAVRPAEVPLTRAVLRTVLVFLHEHDGEDDEGDQQAQHCKQKIA